MIANEGPLASLKTLMRRVIGAVGHIFRSNTLKPGPIASQSREHLPAYPGIDLLNSHLDLENPGFELQDRGVGW